MFLTCTTACKAVVRAIAASGVGSVSLPAPTRHREVGGEGKRNLEAKI